MEKGPVYSDSMGRNPMYNNPYDTRNFGNQSLQAHRAESYRNSPDVLQAKLENELLGKLKGNYLRLPRGGLIFMVFAGKFLFFMITLPPYVLFYGIPKRLMQSQFLKSNRITKRLKEFFNDQIKQKLLQIKLFFIRGISFPKRLMIPLKQPFTSLLKQLSKWNESFREFRFELRQFLIYLPNKLSEKMVKLIEKLEKKHSNLKNPFQPVQNWIVDKGTVIKNQFIKIMEKGSEVINRLIVKPYQSVKNIVVKTQEKVVELLQPPINLLKEKMKIPVVITKRFINKVKEVVEPRLERARELSKSVVESGEKAIQQVNQFTQTAIQAVVVPVINLFAPLVVIKTSAEKAFVRGKGVGKKLVEKVSNVKNHLKSVSKKLVILAKNGASLLKKAIRYSYEALKKTPLQLWRLFLKVVAFIVGVIRRLACVLHLIYTWTRVLFRFAIIELRKSLAS